MSVSPQFEGNVPKPGDLSRRVRMIAGGSIGNFVEWFDWFTYSAFALYFANVFFPAGDQTSQLLKTAGIFAAGFIFRPLGGWIMGRYADKAGRRKAMVVSMVFMSLGSFSIGLAPGYEQIGVLAPVVLLLARILQGLSMGGQFGSSAAYIAEVASPKRRGFQASFLYVTLILGQLMAMALLLVLQQVMDPAQLSAWGWRIPFIVGGVTALLALRLLLRLEESHSFETVQNKVAATSPRPTLRQYRREVLIVLGLNLGGSVAFYSFTTYMQKFLTNTGEFSKDTATQITTVGLVVLMFLQPVMGWLSDRVGRRPLLIAFGALGVLTTYPLMTAISTVTDRTEALILVIVAMAVLSPYTSISALFKAELFPTEIRALGVGLPHALVGSLFGGTAEFVALWLKQQGVESLFYWYVTLCMGVALMTALWMRETKGHSHITEDWVAASGSNHA
jgi:MHS family alpha-ketoglutarate permease-like MFS transporter